MKRIDPIDDHPPFDADQQDRNLQRGWPELFDWLEEQDV